MQQEFDTQRERMQSIIQQKESDFRKLRTELDESQSQLAVVQLNSEDNDRRAQEEILSLQQLVHATIEDSSDSKTEIERLSAELARFAQWQQQHQQDHHHQQQHHGSPHSSIVQSTGASLAPVLSHVKKTIARKLGADTATNDYLEDSMRKVNKYVRFHAHTFRIVFVLFRRCEFRYSCCFLTCCTISGRHATFVVAFRTTTDCGSTESTKIHCFLTVAKAQEDAEVLRSLVVPLEEEIKALKEKLRTTDEELQACQKHQPQTGAGGGRTVESALVGLLQLADTNESTTTPPTNVTTTSAQLDHPLLALTTETATSPLLSPSVPCPECSTLQATIETVRTELAAARADADHVRTELDREAALRRDLEQQWQEKRDEHRQTVQQLEERVAKTEREFAALRQFYGEAKEQMRQHLGRLTADREQTVRHLEQLQKDNDFLAGRFAATATELQNERIDMPCNVDDLQECLLRSHEALIETRVGYELEQRRSRTYLDEARLLAEKQREFETDAEARVRALGARIVHLEAERTKLCVLRDTLQQRDVDGEREARELRAQEIELRAANEKLAQLNADLRQKSTVLQQELANSEVVQQDFVRLSQSLQVQLEKIRAADSTVRWQDEDDVDQCPTCRSAFAVTRRQVSGFVGGFRVSIDGNVSGNRTVWLFVRSGELSPLRHDLLRKMHHEIGAVRQPATAGSRLRRVPHAAGAKYGTVFQSGAAAVANVGCASELRFLSCCVSVFECASTAAAVLSLAKSSGIITDSHWLICTNVFVKL